jgi:hypothetical protein
MGRREEERMGRTEERKKKREGGRKGGRKEGKRKEEGRKEEKAKGSETLSLPLKRRVYYSTDINHDFDAFRSLSFP